MNLSHPEPQRSQNRMNLYLGHFVKINFIQQTLPYIYYELFRHIILKLNYSVECKYISNILKDIHLNSVLN